jgi:hypothetical protein
MGRDGTPRPKAARAGRARDDVTVTEAADVLWMLTSFEAFDVPHGRGLVRRRCLAALEATAERSLCR